MIYLIDNYDSFVYNLARYFEMLGQDTVVVRNDAVDVSAMTLDRIRAIIVSPGPCTPNEAGATLDVIRCFHETIPMLGVCLGHQAIVQALGGVICRAQRPVHGQASSIHHDGRREFFELSQPFVAARYHSLIAEASSIPACLTVSAWTDDRTVMAVRHHQLPVVGWQFHPESILTDVGFQLLAGFLCYAGVDLTNVPGIDREKSSNRRTVTERWPAVPVTF